MATPRCTRNPLFLGRWFEDQIIILCVRWYLDFKLSYRDLVRMMADRGIAVSHTTIMRWVLHYTPEFEKKWKRHARNIGLSWRVDETYVKVRGEWTYLYRAVDGEGRTVDFWLSKRRDVNAAKCFLRRALREHGDPLSITLDAYAASHRAVAQLQEEGEIHYEKMRVRSCQYLNNIVEQDHRRIKQRLYPMLGLKNFENARVVISGIELAQKIRKRQFDLRLLGAGLGSDAEQWSRVLAA